MLSLNLGNGPTRFPKPWINADLVRDIHTDVQMDAENHWPWEDNSFDQVLANHVAEHCIDKLHFITELWRVSKSGAFVRLRVPIYSWSQFWDDPTHKSCWTPETLSWFQQGHSHHTARPFKGGSEFVLIQYEFRGGFELSWDLMTAKPGIPTCAEGPIAMPEVAGTVTARDMSAVVKFYHDH